MHNNIRQYTHVQALPDTGGLRYSRYWELGWDIKSDTDETTGPLHDGKQGVGQEACPTSQSAGPAYVEPTCKAHSRPLPSPCAQPQEHAKVSGGSSGAQRFSPHNFPPPMNGSTWWQSKLWEASAQMRERIPEKPSRKFSWEMFCAGAGSEEHVAKDAMLSLTRSPCACTEFCSCTCAFSCITRSCVPLAYAIAFPIVCIVGHPHVLA